MLKQPYNQALADLVRKEAQREYKRQWRARNPDKVKAANQRYWEKKGQEFLANLTQEGHRAKADVLAAILRQTNRERDVNP